MNEMAQLMRPGGWPAIPLPISMQFWLVRT